MVVVKRHRSGGIPVAAQKKVHTNIENTGNTQQRVIIRLGFINFIVSICVRLLDLRSMRRRSEKTERARLSLDILMPPSLQVYHGRFPNAVHVNFNHQYVKYIHLFPVVFPEEPQLCGNFFLQLG